MLGPDPELGCYGRVAGDEPEPGDLLLVIIRKFIHGREDFWREHDAGKRDRDLRDNGDVIDPFRSTDRHLDKAAESWRWWRSSVRSMSGT